MRFCHLHAHSHFTFLTGTTSPEGIADSAARLGFTHAALTDTNALYGAVPFAEACRNRGINPVIGVHLTARDGNAVILVRDEQGYRNLCRLVTRRRLVAGRFSIAADLPALRGGLVVLVHDPNLMARLDRCLKRDQLYAEVVPHGRTRVSRTIVPPAPDCLSSRPQAVDRSKPPLPTDDVRDGGSDPPPLYHSSDVLDAADRLDRPAVITAAAYLRSPEEHTLHRILVAVRKKYAASGLPARHLAMPRAALLPPSQLAAVMPSTRRVRRALENAAAIASSCEFHLTRRPFSSPSARLEAGESGATRLRRLASARAAELYHPPPPPVVSRLEHELAVIERSGFSGYFLIVQEIVAFARSRGIPVMGRGSAGGSLVAYLLGITAVDPLEHALSFERFLNPARGGSGPPDIDLDLCWRRRDEVIESVFESFGAERVAMIGAFNTYRLRGAFRDAALALGAPPDQVNRLARLLPESSAEAPLEATGRGLAEHPEMRRFPLHRQPYRTALRQAAVMTGIPRHLAIHCGGLVVANERLDGILPLERSAKGVVICQFAMNAVAHMGLVKIDLLGQRGLSAVTDARCWARSRAGGPAVPRQFRADCDEATTRLLRTGRTIGCFQIESPAMRGLLVQMKPRNARELVAALALIRPGPSSSGMKNVFLARHLGLEKDVAVDPRLDAVLGDTHGLMLYQEDVLQVARIVAGISPAEADTLRRAMTKRRSSALMASLREGFLRGACERGFSRSTADHIFRDMQRFVSYSFCKAHAVTYGLLAFEAACLKAHAPAELLAAVIANGGGFYAPFVYIEEARRLGVLILPPCVNRSTPACRPETKNPRGAIRPGLNQIKGLAGRTAAAIVSERNARGPFQSLQEFLQRVVVARHEAEALVLSGAFDATGASRPELLWSMKAGMAARGARRQRREDPGQPGLFAAAAYARSVPIPAIPDHPIEKRVELELEYLGFTPTCHPISLFATFARREGTTSCSDLPRLVGHRVKVLGWLVGSRRVRTGERSAGKNRAMKFLTFEDPTGLIETALQPDVYARLGHRTVATGLYLVEGRIESHFGFVTLDVHDLQALTT